MSERFFIPDTLEEVKSIAPENDQTREITDKDILTPTNILDDVTHNERQKDFHESTVYVWGLQDLVYSHEQLKPIIDQIPEIRMEYPPIEEYSSIDIKANMASRNVTKTDCSNEDVGAVLDAWKYAFDQFNRLYHNPNEDKEFIKDYWDSKAMHFKGILEHVFITRENESSSVLGKVKDLIFDERFDKRAELLEYLTYELWLSGKMVKMSMPYPGDELSPSYQRNKKEYDDKKTILMPIIMKATQNFAEEGSAHVVRRVFEKLETIYEDQNATEMLFTKGLSDRARLNLAVQHMNVFGVVPTIDRISAKEAGNPAISRLYKTLQGKDIEEVMSSLTEVYKAVNFHEYVLNNPELTARESVLIQEQVKEYAEKVRKNPKQVRVIDIGAGTGRHSVALHRLGYDVTALEFEQHHVKKIKEQEGDIKAIVADWHNIPYPNGRYNDETSPEVFYCLGRTILHNNTPEKMARYFDEMQRVLTYRGVGIIDIPIIPEERVSEVTNQYSAEIQRYTEHLESLGVEPGRARNIFDGPDERHKFNRMTITDAQFRAYSKLFGFRVKKVEEAKIGDNDLFNNAYYVIEKDPDFVVDDMKPQEFRDAVASIGLLDPGIDYNRYVDAWGLPLGIPIMFMSGNQPESLLSMRQTYRRGGMGEISTQLDNGTIYFEFSHRPSSRGL